MQHRIMGHATQLESAKELPAVKIQPDLSPAAKPVEPAYVWRGARIRELRGGEYSAYGVSQTSGGIAFAGLPARSRAMNDGFRAGDLIQSVDGKRVRQMVDFVRALRETPAGQPVAIGVVRNQAPVTFTLAGPVEARRL